MFITSPLSIISPLLLYFGKIWESDRVWSLVRSIRKIHELSLGAATKVSTPKNCTTVLGGMLGVHS